MQWIDLANLHDDLRTIVRTAGAVFPYFDVFYEPPRAALFVGALRPLEGRPHMRARDVPRAVTRGLRAPVMNPPTPVGQPSPPHGVPRAPPTALWSTTSEA